MTPLDLITLALQQAGVVGIGQPASAEDANSAFTLANMMLGQWNAKRWLVYHLLDVSCVGTGAQSYTIGPGGDFDTLRPDRIEGAYVRLLNTAASNQVDYPLRLLQSMEDYSLVGQKGLIGFPQYAFLDSDFPLGRLYLWPIPTGVYEVHVLIKSELASFADLATEITLPAEYQEAIMYNLAARLRPQYQLPPDGTVTALARAALNTIRNSNSQIPALLMPVELRRGSNYNVLTDTVY